MTETGPTKCSLTSREILEDIEAISSNEEYRKKLYMCIDDRVPPQDNSFKKIEGFLKGTQELEDLLKGLKEAHEEAANSKINLIESVGSIREKLRSASAMVNIKH